MKVEDLIMIIEICIATVSVCIVMLTIYAIFAILAMKKCLDEIKVDLKTLSNEGTELIRNVNELNEDVKNKAQSLDFIFEFLDTFNQKKSEKISEEPSKTNKSSEKIAEILDVIGSGISLVNRIKGDIKKYVK
jgi:uncharacterized protein YoxC